MLRTEHARMLGASESTFHAAIFQSGRSGRAPRGTRASEAGGIELACLARPVRRYESEGRERSDACTDRKPFSRAQRAARSAQAALLRKGSPDSGTGCAGRDLSCDDQDDRRSGTYHRTACRIVRTSGSTRCLRVNFRTYRSIFDIALGQAPSQSISTEVCKLSCLCTTCTLHCPHIQTFMTVSRFRSAFGSTHFPL